MKKTIKIILLVILAMIMSFSVFIGIRHYQFVNLGAPEAITSEQEKALDELNYANYRNRFEVLKPLPYMLPERTLDVYAESAILINASNGNILYEKNADEIIPPASMTKLFAMYVLDEEVASGRFKYNQYIPLPPECWACNMPPRSSLMFLGEGQRVTLEELVLGLAICSGNDAAYALAYTVAGSMEGFVEKMNQVASDLGLENTHFVESSGYSELNTTTAREMAKFSAIYLEKHPDSLKRFHSVPSFTYPKEKNLARGDHLASQDFSQGIPKRITMSITQKNTNPLLGVMEGCDGLKTGYIDESGYNLSLTASRDGTRYISVTMKGPGANNSEGQAGRVHDGTELMEWAFASFKDYDVKKMLRPYPIKCYSASEMNLNAVPAFDENIVTIPYIVGDSLEENLAKVKVYVDIPPFIWGEIEQGDKVGSIKILLDKYLIDEIPLVSDRKIEKSNGLVALVDRILLLFQ